MKKIILGAFLLGLSFSPTSFLSAGVIKDYYVEKWEQVKDLAVAVRGELDERMKLGNSQRQDLAKRLAGVKPRIKKLKKQKKGKAKAEKKKIDKKIKGIKNNNKFWKRRMKQANGGIKWIAKLMNTQSKNVRELNKIKSKHLAGVERKKGWAKSFGKRLANIEGELLWIEQDLKRVKAKHFM